MFFGAIAGLVPFVDKFLTIGADYFREKQEHKHELERIRVSGEISLKQMENQARSMVVQAQAKTVSTAHKHDSTLQKGSDTWVVNLRASVRPILTYGTLLSTITIIVLHGLDVIHVDTSVMFWLQTVTEAIVAFWFGGRLATDKFTASK